MRQSRAITSVAAALALWATTLAGCGDKGGTHTQHDAGQPAEASVPGDATGPDGSPDPDGAGQADAAVGHDGGAYPEAGVKDGGGPTADSGPTLCGASNCTWVDVDTCWCNWDCINGHHYEVHCYAQGMTCDCYQDGNWSGCNPSTFSSPEVCQTSNCCGFPFGQ